MTESLNYLNVCEKVSKISIYLLVFFLPLFFLPWTGDILNFNKQALLVFLVFIAFFAWMLKILISGKFSFTISWVHIPLIVLFLVLVFSTLFSLYPYGSFWGWPQVSSESLLTLLSLILFYFLAVNIFKKKEISNLIISLIFSGFFAAIFGIFQFFGKFLFPFAFSKTSSFNTIGSQSGLAIFIAVLLPLITLFIIKIQKKSLKLFFIASAILSVFLLILVNFLVAWWLVIIGAILTITLIAQKRDFLDNRWLVLPMVFLAIALFFVFFKPQIPGLPNGSTEVFLSQKAGLSIAWESLKENPVFGTGPGTFLFDFSKYKAADFNKSQFWNVRFGKSGSEFLNSLTTTGILGILSFLSLIGIFIFYGIKSLFVKQRKRKKQNLSKETEIAVNKELRKEDKGFFWVLAAGIFISFLVLTAGYFLYSSNLSLNFIFFLFLASFGALIFPKGEFLLKPSSLTTLAFTFVFTLFFVFGSGIFILEAQRYIASADYQKGINAWQQGKSEEAVSYMEKATRINPRVDIYWRQLSQFYLQRINEVAQSKDLSKEDINKQIQLYINNSVNSTKAAIDTNPKNVANWSVRGFVYQSLIGVINGVDDWAIKSYDSALELEPINPYFPTQKGIVFLSQSSLLSKDKEEERNSLLKKAEGQFEKAINLKSDYAPAHFQLAMTYQAEGKEKEAIKKLEATKIIVPFDVGLAFQLGLTYYQNKDYQKAAAELERAVSLNSNYSNALYFLGLTYSQLDENNKAIKEFEEVARLNPGNSQVNQILSNLKSGKSALTGLVEKQPPVVPIEEEQPELKNQPSEKEPSQPEE